LVSKTISKRDKAKAKYRGLSTAAAKTPPPVEMTWFYGGMLRKVGFGLGG
jgi:hypothetical protein